ncbi:MAG: nuclear transport factor 2 family protein [Candidatus Eremiobacteraeota bacterium]|nr:nuclear transport factor 2 family protein [Candidatus Eremiobacteraeota bacterium]
MPRTVLRALLAAAVLPLAATASTASTGTSADEAALVALNAQFQDAVKNDDAAALDRIVADDYVLYGSSNTPVTKRGVLDDARESHYDLNESSDVRARVWGDTGVVTARLHQTGTADGKRFDVTVRFTDVYARTAAGWRQVSAHATSMRTGT